MLLALGGRRLAFVRNLRPLPATFSKHTICLEWSREMSHGLCDPCYRRHRCWRHDRRNGVLGGLNPRRPLFNCSVRRPNAELRTREYLTDAEVARLTDAAKANRYGQRDATMILVAYRHGLRASELADLRWDQVDFESATLAVPRGKKGSPSTHPIRGDELRALRRLQREQEPKSPFVFTSERGAPFTTAGFARMVERAGQVAELGFKAHPHMQRHACGFALAN